MIVNLPKVLLCRYIPQKKKADVKSRDRDMCMTSGGVDGVREPVIISLSRP